VYLGYDARWLEFGAVSETRVIAQAAEARSEFGEREPLSEHYRWAAFVEHVGGRECFSDEEVDRLLALCEADPDAAAGRAMFIRLLSHRGLTGPQLEMTTTSRLARECGKEISRARLLLRLREGEWSAELLDEVVEHGDGGVQRWLLEDSRVDRGVLMRLADRGANKAVRHMAAHMLGARRFRG
jgi:hypothetical protein